MKYFILKKSNVPFPAIAIGTDGLTHDTSTKIIAHSLDMGYQLIDTATGYGTHKTVSEAIKRRNRADFFVCSKFHNGDIVNQPVKKIVSNILSELEISYIDVLLIHNPAVNDFPSVLKQLIEIKKQGKIKAIGVSNFTIKHLEMIKPDLDHIEINQIEFHPYLFQRETLSYCRNHDIHIMAYRPLCQGKVLNDGIITAIADSHQKSTAQIVLRWAIQMGMTPVVRANSLMHVKENIDIFNFELSQNEMLAIERINKNLRTCIGPWADFDDIKAI